MLGSKNVIVLAALTSAVMIITTAANAAHVTINTNDGIVDVNWSSAHVINSTTGAAPDYDIDDAWVGNEADNSALYFRVSLAPGGQLPTDYDSLEVRLDCNKNGSFTDPRDVVVYYALDLSLVTLDNPLGEEVVECQGSDYIDCTYALPNTSDLNAVTFGEEITGSPNNYEWRADVTNGDTDWSACFGSVNVQFASMNAKGQVQDVTLWYEYSLLSNVTLADMSARNNLSTPVVAIVLGVAALGSLVVVSQRKNLHS